MVSAEQAHGSGHEHQIEVKVNHEPVKFTQEHVTGMVIKTTAIAQGVDIQPDFCLFIEVKHDEQQPIGDDQGVDLHSGDMFIAVGPDHFS